MFSSASRMILIFMSPLEKVCVLAAMVVESRKVFQLCVHLTTSYWWSCNSRRFVLSSRGNMER